MMSSSVTTNSFRAWFLAARPKTLAGAAVPVMMGLALAYYDLQRLSIVPAILCILFAFVMQIDANFVNDYFDYRRGTDDAERLGPERACAQGWITERNMLWGIAVTTLLACCVGLPLVFYGGWWLVAIGALCVVFCILYTTHFSYWGLGDVLVLVFFGVIPVTMTYYLQTDTITLEAFCASVACGLAIDALLMVNNYRDREGDRKSRKLTIVVRVGEIWSERLYFILGLAACLMGIVFLVQGRYFVFGLPFIYLVLHAKTYRQMCQINHGRALNQILGLTARNIFLYGLLFSLGAILDVVI